MKLILFFAALLFAIVSFASASITLSGNFMPFTGLGGADDDCRAIYNSRIDQCTDSIDFLDGKYCTAGCQQALNNIEARLNNFCRGVFAEQGTLLHAIFEKKLVESVCRDGGAAEPQSSPRVTTTTKPVATTTAQTTLTASNDDDDDEEATTTIKITSSSSIFVTISTSTASATTQTSQRSFVPVSTTSSAAPAKTNAPSWRELARQQQACAILQGGGGGPFDSMVGFKFPTDAKDRQHRIRECENMAAQRARQLKKNDASSCMPSSRVAMVIAIGVGLMVLV